MREIGKILAKKRKALNLSQVDMIEALEKYEINIKKSAYSTWETGVSYTNAPQLLALCQILQIKDIYQEFIGSYDLSSPLALLNDEGKQKVDEYIQLLIASGQYENRDNYRASIVRDIKLYQMPVSAGTGNFLDGEEYEMIQVGNEVPSKADFGVRISGNSMEPRYMDRQIIWIQQSNTLHDGEIGIFMLNGSAYCKKLQNTESGTMLISLNKDYNPIQIAEYDDFHIFGRVLN